MGGPPRVAPQPRGSGFRQRLSNSMSLKFLSPESIHSYLSPWAFRCVWISIISVHFCVGTVRFVTAVVHILLANPAAYAAVSMVQIPPGVLMATGWSMGVIAVAHFVAGAALLVFSWRAKRLTLSRDSSRELSPTTIIPHGPTAAHVAPRKHRACCLTVGIWLRSIWNFFTRRVDGVLGVDGLVGVNGPYFFEFVDTLDAFKLVTQTYQAYLLSRFVFSTLVNTLIVVIIFLNGTLPSLVAYWAQDKRKGTQRLAVVSIDFILDIIYAEAIPGLVLLPIMTEFDWNIGAFPPRVSFNNMWANNSVAQTRYVLVTSYLDLVTTIVPHLNCIANLHLLKKLIHHRSQSKGIAGDATRSQSARPLSLRSRRIFRGWKSVLHRVVLVSWSIVVVVLHAHAQQQDSTIAGCKMPLAPWRLFGEKLVACAVMHINCYRMHSEGRAPQMEAVLDPLDKDALTAVVFTHCPALEVPSIITRFSGLVAVEFFNNSLVSWDSNGALTDATHKLLHHVFFFATNMTQLPAALVHNKLPKTFQYFAIYGSNITQLPDTLGDVWCSQEDSSHKWRVLSIIGTTIRELPNSLANLDIEVLQLIDNDIERLPVHVSRRLDRYMKLRLSGAKFQELPSFVDFQDHERTRLRRLYVENTNVSVLSSWLTLWLDESFGVSHGTTSSRLPLQRVSFHKSRLCDSGEYTRYSRFCDPIGEFDLDNFPFEIITAQWKL